MTPRPLIPQSRPPRHPGPHTPGEASQPAGVDRHRQHLNGSDRPHLGRGMYSRPRGESSARPPRADQGHVLMSTALTSMTSPSVHRAKIVGMLSFLLGVQRRYRADVSTMDTRTPVTPFPWAHPHLRNHQPAQGSQPNTRTSLRTRCRQQAPRPRDIGRRGLIAAAPSAIQQRADASNALTRRDLLT